LDSPAALVRFAGRLISETYAGTLTPDIARVLFYGLSVQRQLVESSDIEERVKALEEQLAKNGGQRACAG
jgi:hypothetical protein